MTVWRAPFSVELTGPDAGLNRSLSAMVILRFLLCSPSSPVKSCYCWKAVVFLRPSWFSRSARQNHRENTIQSP
jgi:hypothetical protein